MPGYVVVVVDLDQHLLYNCDAQINQPPWICNNQPMHGSYLVSLKINKALLWFTIYIDE